MVKTATRKPRKVNRATHRLKKLKANIVRSSGTFGEAMVKSGYSKAYSTNPKQLMQTRAFQKEVQPIINKMGDLREISLEHATKKAPKASYRDLIYGLDVTTKHIELLSGRATQRTLGVVAHLSTQELLAMAEEEQPLHVEAQTVEKPKE